MTPDDIIHMTIEASATGCADELTGDAIERFAKLVAAKEREACAKLCGSEKKWWSGMSHAEEDIYQAIDNISACIRARGK